MIREVSWVRTMFLSSLPMSSWSRKSFRWFCSSEAWHVNFDHRKNREGFGTAVDGCSLTPATTSSGIWSGEGLSLKAWWRRFTALRREEAVSLIVILLRMTSWTRRCMPRVFELFLWKRENFVNISTIWHFIGQEKLLLDRDGSSVERSWQLINSSWISFGSKKAAISTKWEAISPCDDFVT